MHLANMQSRQGTSQGGQTKPDIHELSNQTPSQTISFWVGLDFFSFLFFLR